jgi:hypothetical protein
MPAMVATGTKTAMSASDVATNAAFHLGRHGLHHHDRVVDDDADGQHQAQQRERVDREAEQREQGERADQRHRHGERRNQRRAEALQEDVDDEDHQGDGLEQRDHDLANAGGDRQGGIERDDVLDVLRKTLLEPRHRLEHGACHLEPVRVRQLEHLQKRRRLAIGGRADQVVLSAELDVGDVAQQHLRAVVVGPDDDLAELLGRLEATGRLHRVGELRALRRRRPPELARRHQHVLLANRTLEVADRQVELRELIGTHPHAHRVLGDAAAQNLRLSHAADARELVDDVDRGVVGEELLVVGAARRDQ